MKLLFRCCGLFLLLAWPPAVWAQPSIKVVKVEIKHIGPASVSDDLIQANIRVKAGDPYLPAAVDDDVRNLYATGLFYNIQVTRAMTGDGMVLTYAVQGRPQLTDIKFQGNKKYSDAKLRKKLTSKVGEPLDERKLFTDSQDIQTRYQKAGYPGTTVKSVPVVIEDTGRATTTFEIVEGHKIKITKVEFVGAKAFTQKKLRKEIKTRKRWMFSWLTGSGVFKDEQFQDDKDKLGDFYREHGYIDFDIKEVQFEHPTTNTMVIRFILYEGRQYKIGSVKFDGNKIFSTKEICTNLTTLNDPDLPRGKYGTNGLLMDVGDVFTPKGYQNDILQVEDFYGARGYIDVKQGPNLKVARVPNTESGTMDLEFVIDEGRQYSIEKIEIRGNTKTKDKVIRRELAVSPGEVFDMVKVRVSKERLENMQYFEKVDTRPEPTDPVIEGRENLVVGVDEKNTGSFSVGAGFSSVDALVGFAEIKQGNFDLFHPPTFTGGGQKLRLFMQLGTQRQDYEIEFTEPWLFGRKLTLDVDLYHNQLNFLSPNNLYDEVRTGGRVSLLRALPKPDFFESLLGKGDLIGGVSYTFEQIGILLNESIIGAQGPGPQPPPPNPRPQVPDDILAEQGYSLISKFGTSLTYDSRNSTFLPNKGQRTGVSAEFAGPFGGEVDYYKLELQTGWYFKGIGSGDVLELVGKTGVADSYGSSSQVPFYDRFYLGGLDSLRGFKYHNVSPRQANSDGFHSNEPIGGDTYWFGSAEYSIPIIQSEKGERGTSVRFALFYDIGAVAYGPYTLHTANFDDNWGLGLHLNLPIGPLRLEYGVPIHHDQYNSGSGKFQFGVGYHRPF